METIWRLLPWYFHPSPLSASIQDWRLQPWKYLFPNFTSSYFKITVIKKAVKLLACFLIVATTQFPYHLLSKLLVDVINNAVELLARAKGQQVSRPALTNIQGLKQFSIRCYPSNYENDLKQFFFGWSPTINGCKELNVVLFWVNSNIQWLKWYWSGFILVHNIQWLIGIYRFQACLQFWFDDLKKDFGEQTTNSNPIIGK